MTVPGITPTVWGPSRLKQADKTSTLNEDTRIISTWTRTVSGLRSNGTVRIYRCNHGPHGDEPQAAGVLAASARMRSIHLHLAS